MRPTDFPTEKRFDLTRRGALKSLAVAGLLAGGLSTPALAAPPAETGLNVRLFPVERDPRVRWEVKDGVVYDGSASDGRRLWTYEPRDGTVRDTTGAVAFRIEDTSRGSGRLFDADGDLVATLAGTVVRVADNPDGFWFRASETSEDAGVLFDPAAFPGLVVRVSGTGSSGATRRRGDVVLCDVTVVRESAVLKLVVVAILVSFLPRRVAAERDPQPIECGQSRVSRLGPRNRIDAYRLAVDEPTDVAVTMTVGTRRGDGEGNARGQDDVVGLRPVLELVDPDGNVIGRDETIDGRSLRIDARLPASRADEGYDIIALDFTDFAPEVDGYNYRLTVDCD